MEHAAAAAEYDPEMQDFARLISASETIYLELGGVP